MSSFFTCLRVFIRNVAGAVFFVAGVFSPAGLVFGQADTSLVVKEVQIELAMIEAEAEKKRQQISTHYIKQLTGLERSYQQEGNLDAILVVRNEKLAVEKHADLGELELPAISLNAPTALRQKRQAYDLLLLKYVAWKDAQRKEKVSKAIKNLEAAKVKLTKAGKIQEALDVAKILESLKDGAGAAPEQGGASLSTKGLLLYIDFDGPRGSIVNKSSRKFKVANKGVTIDANGVRGKAGAFDGERSHLMLDIPKDLTTLGDYTYSVWVKTSATIRGNNSVDRQYIIGNHGPTPTQRDDFMKQGSSLCVDVQARDKILSGAFYQAPRVYDEKYTYAKIVNAWTHLVVRRNGADREIWINNEKMTVTNRRAAKDSAFAVSSPWYIGDFAGGNPYYGGRKTTYNFHGLMDEVMIFDRAVSDEEIASLYKRGGAMAKKDANTPPSSRSKTELLQLRPRSLSGLGF